MGRHSKPSTPSVSVAKIAVYRRGPQRRHHRPGRSVAGRDRRRSGTPSRCESSGNWAINHRKRLPGRTAVRPGHLVRLRRRPVRPAAHLQGPAISRSPSPRRSSPDRARAPGRYAVAGCPPTLAQRLEPGPGSDHSGRHPGTRRRPGSRRCAGSRRLFPPMRWLRWTPRRRLTFRPRRTPKLRSSHCPRRPPMPQDLPATQNLPAAQNLPAPQDLPADAPVLELITISGDGAQGDDVTVIAAPDDTAIDTVVPGLAPGADPAEVPDRRPRPGQPADPDADGLGRLRRCRRRNRPPCF